MPASTILVLESAAIGDASLAPILISAGYTVTQTSDPAEAIAQVVEHQLVAIDVGSGIAGQTGFELCHQVRATPTKVSIPILCVAATDDVDETDDNDLPSGIDEEYEDDDRERIGEDESEAAPAAID